MIDVRKIKALLFHWWFHSLPFWDNIYRCSFIVLSCSHGGIPGCTLLVVRLTSASRRQSISSPNLCVRFLSINTQYNFVIQFVKDCGTIWVFSLVVSTTMTDRYDILLITNNPISVFNYRLEYIVDAVNGVISLKGRLRQINIG